MKGFVGPDQDVMYDIELKLLPNKTYEWRIFLCAQVCIREEMLTPIVAEPNVIDVDVRMRDHGSKHMAHCPVCITVSSMERDMEMGGTTHQAPVAKSLDGRSYTQQVLEQKFDALADTAAAAAALSD